VFQGCMPEEEGNIALVLVDVDILGHINEGWGQEQGDSIITELGRVIRGLNISGMLASRYADDEFALLLPGFDEEKALNLAAEIRNELLDRRLPPFKNKGKHGYSSPGRRRELRKAFTSSRHRTESCKEKRQGQS